MNSLKRKASSIGDATDAKKPKSNGNIASFFGSAPKPTESRLNGTSPSMAVSKFDKAKWVATLNEEQKKLLALEIDTLDESWLAHLKDDITSKDFLELKKFLDRETAAGKKWFPPKEDIYSWSRHTKFGNVKVVILGQDPYHNVNQAHGMAFSVRPPTPTPPSLRNMYICLQNDYPNFITPPKNNGLLTPWADRGVLMLNTCLTVRAHEANSHANRGWEKFTQRIIDLVAQKRTRGVVFMAWGTPAGKRVARVNKQSHLVLQAVHPSPLSASRGYFTCGHYKKANEWLSSRYGPNGQIDWGLVPGNSTLPAKDEDAAATADSINRADDGSKSEGTKAKPKSNEATMMERENVPIEEKMKSGQKGTSMKSADDEFADLDVDSDEEAALQEAMKQADEEAQAKK